MNVSFIIINRERRFFTMDIITFNSLIETSAPEDWLVTDEENICVLNKDLMINIKREESDTDSPFTEEWATHWPDHSAYVQRFLLRYGENTVETFYTASIDGNRAFIPYPDLTDMTITRRQYAIGLIVNEAFSGRLEEYLRAGKITVKQ